MLELIDFDDSIRCWQSNGGPFCVSNAQANIPGKSCAERSHDMPFGLNLDTIARIN